MSRELVVQGGQPPWRPSPDTELREVFNSYDMPLEGLFVQEDRWYVFRCIVDEVADDNLWAYAQIRQDEAALLLDEDSPLDDTLAEVTAGRVSTVAAAGPDGIVASWSLEHIEGRPGSASIMDTGAILRAAIAALRQIKSISVEIAS
jgi:hypothetical protein